MARKSTGTTTRSKKAAASTEPVVMQPSSVEIAQEVVRKTVAVSAVSGNKNGGNLDEEIRRRAYELYLQRNGTGGDPNADWFVAEREVRARHATAGHSA
jgi:Protein of unknown function (DUF2934)